MNCWIIIIKNKYARAFEALGAQCISDLSYIWKFRHQKLLKKLIAQKVIKKVIKKIKTNNIIIFFSDFMASNTFWLNLLRKVLKKVLKEKSPRKILKKILFLLFRIQNLCSLKLCATPEPQSLWQLAYLQGLPHTGPRALAFLC